MSVLVLVVLLFGACASIESLTNNGQDAQKESTTTKTTVMDLDAMLYSEAIAEPSNYQQFKSLQGRYMQIKEELTLIWYAYTQDESLSSTGLASELRSRKIALYVIYKDLNDLDVDAGMDSRKREVMNGVQALLLSVDSYETHLANGNSAQSLMNRPWRFSDRYDEAALDELLYYWKLESAHRNYLVMG